MKILKILNPYQIYVVATVFINLFYIYLYYQGYNNYRILLLVNEI